MHARMRERPRVYQQRPKRPPRYRQAPSPIDANNLGSLAFYLIALAFGLVATGFRPVPAEEPVATAVLAVAAAGIINEAGDLAQSQQS